MCSSDLISSLPRSATKSPELNNGKCGTLISHYDAQLGGFRRQIVHDLAGLRVRAVSVAGVAFPMPRAGGSSHRGILSFDADPHFVGPRERVPEASPTTVGSTADGNFAVLCLPRRPVHRPPAATGFSSLTITPSFERLCDVSWKALRRSQLWRRQETARRHW